MNDTTETSSETGSESVPLSSNDRTWGIIAHLSGIFTSFFGPLVIWLIKKEESAFLNGQSKEALNFQITIAIAMFISALLSIVVIGFLLMPIVALAALVLSILAAVKVSNGEAYRYPFTLRLVK